jgi:phosphoribosylanthranilate isomerase
LSLFRLRYYLWQNGLFVRTRVKICGITRVEDALSAVEQGADAIGLVFYPPSPRYVSVSQAAEIAQVLPAFVSVVGLFVDAPSADIEAVLLKVPIDLIQFHGNETPEQCRRYEKPYIKAIRVKTDTNLIQYQSDFSDAKALLLDTYTEGVPGGTGQVFDWNVIPKHMTKQLVLAGGLDANNVTQAIKLVKPYAVDVSGGVESAKGIKDAAKIAAFMRGVSDAIV